VGRPVHSRRLAGGQWWLANAGLMLLAAGFVLRARAYPLALPLLGAGGSLSAVAACLFAYNVWRTLDAPAPAAVRTVSASGTPLPLAERHARS
jgi:hypothetical protein